MNMTDENRMEKKVEVSSCLQPPKDGMAWTVAGFMAILFLVMVAVAGCSPRQVLVPGGSSAPLPNLPKHGEAGMKYRQWRDGERTADKRNQWRKVNASTVNPVPLPDDGGTSPSEEFKK